MTRLSGFAWTENRDVSEVAVQCYRRVGRALFGDRWGLVLFLGTLALVSTYWRVGVFITDSYAFANALVNVADGHLAITEIEYSLNLGSQPGLWYVDGSVYARNYAHVFLSLPVLWLLDGLSALFDLRLVLAAAWSGLVFALFDQLGRLLDRRRGFITTGSVVALVTFLGHTLVASPLSETWTAFAALQITTLLATAFLSVVLYRVLAHAHGRRVGLLFGAAAVVASPVGFWASIPKRHALSALAVTVVLGAFYFSRAAETRQRTLGARALAYAVLALFAWLHALEALVVFAIFVPLDLATAQSNRPRQLAVVGVVFLVALGPFFLTNMAINDDPFQPPRSMEAFSGQVDPISPDVDDGSGAGGEATPTPTPNQTATDTPAQNGTTPTNATDGPRITAGPDSEGTPDSGPALPWPLSALVTVVTTVLTTAVDRSVWAFETMWSYVDIGITIAQNDPERLYHIFVRSGRIPEYIQYQMTDQEAVDLALLEVAPLLGGLIGVIGAGLRRMRTGLTRDGLVAALGRPTRQTDALAVAMTLALILINLDRLPLHTQLTVRYLVPIVPLGLYGVSRLSSIHRVARADPRWLAGAYVGGLLIGGVGFLAVNAWLGLALGEAMQLHALVGLASASVLALWATVEGIGVQTDIRLGIAAIAIPASLTTLFLLFSGFVYFPYAEQALPLARTLAELLPVTI